MTSWQTVRWTYYWTLWIFLVGLVFAQFSCVFWDSSTRHEATVEGRLPADGLHDLPVDPEPYADRIVVCALNGGRQYQPMQLTRALARLDGAQLEDPTSSAATSGGYRVMHRALAPGLSRDASARFSTTCDLIAWTLDAILDSCTALGYNVTRDYARIVNGLNDSSSVVGILDALPILIEPTSDESLTSRYIVPGYDGSACIVRLLGKYETPKSASALILRGVQRTLYEQRTVELLQLNATTKPRGVWRHGWFEANDGSKWHSEVISTGSGQSSDSYSVLSRVFDTEHNIELPGSAPTAWPLESTWGPIASASDTLLWYQSLAISNGTHFGIHRVESSRIHVVRSKFTLETLLVNLSISWVLLRWAACMVALQRFYKNGNANVAWQAASIGDSVSCMRGFQLLPFVLLVRLKPIMAAISTSGAWFTSDQRAASEAWFVIYPAIAEMVFLHFSVLNIVAKMMRRRVSDAMFGPTVAFFCLLHLVRCFVFPTPLTSYVSSAEIEDMTIPAMVSPSVVLRLNGRIGWLVYLKLAVLFANWLPLVCFYNSDASIRKQSLALTACHVERALALRVTNLGGFGSAHVFTTSLVQASERSTGVVIAGEASMPSSPALMPAEFLRMGYVLLSSRYALSFNDYFLLVLLTPWRRREFPPHFRIVAFTLTPQSSNDRAAMIALQPEIIRLNDPRLRSVDLFNITTTLMY